MLALCLALPCHAQEAPSDAVHDFAARILALTGPGAATLATTNSSSATPEQFATFRKALQRGLQEDGLHLRQALQASSEIRVTLSENARGLVYLAEVQQGSEVREVIVEAPRGVAETPVGSAMNLRRTLLISQTEPVLDAVQMQAGKDSSLLLLTPRAVNLYRQQNGAWVADSSSVLALSQSLPLDPRGRLIVTGDRTLDAYLPGAICQISITGTLHAECHDADDPWPMKGQAAFFNSSANYFNGLLRPGFGKQLTPFFAMAAIPYPSYTLWVFSGVDGQFRTHDGVRPGTLNVHDWGSDLASVHSGCGSGTQLLVTAMTDAGANDSLRAFELVERQPVLAAPAMEFSGTITALWTADDGAGATAVVRSPRTGDYEVFHVTMGCTQ